MTESKLQTALDELRSSDAVQQASSVVDRVEKAINEIRNSVQELRAAKNG